MHSFGLEDRMSTKIFTKGMKSGKNEDEKSFNRYVRQLVDQYLDKEVVISKQPEDKVELIVQACRDRFPEYAHWTTTRIRIYIESCRRLKKIKNSPILLAKRKAAGRRFREGQKLKKMLASQFSIQAAEANRQLAEYLLRHGNVMKPDHLDQQEQQHKQAVLDESMGKVDMLIDQPEPLPPPPPPPVSVVSTPANVLPPTSLPGSSTSPPSVRTPAFSSSPTSPGSGLLMAGSPSPIMTLPTMAFAAGSPKHQTNTIVSRTPSPPKSAGGSERSVFFQTPVSSSGTCSPLSLGIKEERQPWSSPQLAQSHYLQVLTDMLHSKRAESVAAATPDRQLPPSSKPNTATAQKSFQIESLMGLQQPLPQKQPAPVSTTQPIPVPAPLPLFQKKPHLPEMSMSEILNAKTLVTSYREAANFLYRAASELEQLLPNNHRVF